MLKNNAYLIYNILLIPYFNVFLTFYAEDITGAMVVYTHNVSILRSQYNC